MKTVKIKVLTLTFSDLEQALKQALPSRQGISNATKIFLTQLFLIANSVYCKKYAMQEYLGQTKSHKLNILKGGIFEIALK